MNAPRHAVFAALLVVAVACGEATPVTPAPARVFRPIGDVLLLWQSHGRIVERRTRRAPLGASSTEGPVVPDSKIAYDVSTKIAPLEGEGAEIDVFVDGQEVRLVGRVPSAFQADEAEEAARQVYGVRRVVNDLAWPR